MTTELIPNPSQEFKIRKDELQPHFDISITVGESLNDVQTFHSNKETLLCLPYFKTLLDEANDENIQLPDISPKIFEIILKYLNTKNLDLNELKSLKNQDIVDLLIATKKLGLEEVSGYLQNHLFERRSQWMEYNFLMIYDISSRHDFRRLQEFCNDFIENSPELIFQLKDFIGIPSGLLLSLIKRDDLLLDEAIIWENVLKWGLIRNPNLPDDPTTWSNENSKEFKNTLKDFLPLIRFSHFSSAQFYDAHKYVRQFDDKLEEELLRFYLVPGTPDRFPPRSNEIGKSKIINDSVIFNNVFIYLSKLINNEMMYRDLDVNQRYHYGTNPYELKLLLRGSRHGFTPKVFHDLCDYKPGTITIIKVKGKDEILGGYNPGEWQSKNGYGNYDKSFIFSFKDNFENTSISHVDYSERALNYGLNYGPSFGLSDLIISGQNFKYGGYCYCKMDDYKVHIRHTENSFLIEDYEVFQVIKKSNSN